MISTSDQTQSGTDTSRDALPSYRRLTTVAGLTIIIAGVWHILQGVAALAGDGRFVSPPNYIYKFELTGWSWIYLLLGTCAVTVGFAVFTGQVWGRVAGILLAMLSMCVNFVFLPWYPTWSLLMIGLDVAVIWIFVGYQRHWNEAAAPPS